MCSRIVGEIEGGWDDEHEGYMCRDGTCVYVQRRNSRIRELDNTKTASRNGIRYRAGKKEPRIAVSGTEFGRCMRKIFGGPDDIRTMIFPSMVRTIR